MTLLQALTLIWCIVVVLVLAVTVILTGLALHSARKHLDGVADNLETVARQAVPLEPKLTAVMTELGGIAAALGRVDAGLGKILEVVGGLVARKG